MPDFQPSQDELNQAITDYLKSGPSQVPDQAPSAASQTLPYILGALAPGAGKMLGAGIGKVLGAGIGKVLGMAVGPKVFKDLGQMQRGGPEHAMLKVQNTMGGGVLNPVVEHAGDLVHRMTEMAPYGDYGYKTVKNKVDKVHSWLTHPYGFEREMNQNIASNAAYRGIPESQLRSQLDSALKTFGDEHAKLPAYNDAHRIANEINTHIGNKNWNGVIEGLEKLKGKLGSREEWDKFASEGLGPQK